MHFGFCCIPVIIININHIRVIIFFIIHFFLTLDSKHRFFYRYNQFLIRTDHRIFILQGIIHFNQLVQRNIGFNGNSGQRITGNHLINLIFLFITCHFINGKADIRQLVLIQISLGYLYIIPEIHWDYTKLIVLKVLLDIRFNLIKQCGHICLESGFQCHSLCCFFLFFYLFTRCNRRTHNRKFSCRIKLQFHLILFGFIIFIYRCLQKCNDLIQIGKIDNFFINFDNIGLNHGFLHVGGIDLLHVIDNKLRRIHSAP